MKSGTLPEPSPRVVPLRGDHRAELVGAKAWRLAQLDSRHPIPDGFVVTTIAFQHLMRQLEMIPLPNSPTETMSPRDIRPFVDRFQQVLAATALPRDLVDEIGGAYRAVGSPAVAVRSSAVGEDEGVASWAGQFETILNVQGLDNLVEAVLRCWASAWNPRALAYRLQLGLPAGEMAVLVQILVNAEVAGTMFSKLPESGTEQTVIESCWGLGAAVGDGTMATDRFATARGTGEVEVIKVAAKLFMVAPGVAGGVRLEPVPKERQAVPSLHGGQILELAQIARQLEEALRGPVDVEWAIEGSTIWILQVRPVTGSAQDGWQTPPEPHRHDWWVRAPVAEALPGLVSPFTWSICGDMWNKARRALYGSKAQAGELAFLRLYKQRAFLNIGGHRYLEGNPLLSSSATPDELPRGASSSYIPSTIEKWSRRALVTAGRFLILRLTAEGRFRRAARVSTPSPEALSTSSERELVVTLHRLVAMLGRLEMLAAAIAEASFVGAHLLQLVHRRWTGLPDCTDLLSAGHRTRRAQMVAALSRIAVKIRSLPEVTDYVISHRAFSRTDLAALPSGPEVVRALDGFLAEFGHRCSHELEWRSPRWQEQPAAVEELLHHLVRAPTGDPWEALRRQRVREGEALLRVRQRIRARASRGLAQLRWRAFLLMLTTVRGLLATRENCRHYMLLVVMRGRRIVLELGLRLARQNILLARDDVFMLTLAEIEEALAGTSAATPDFRLRVARRHVVEEIAKRASIPPALDRKGLPVWAENDAQTVLPRTPLKGTRIVSGRVRSIARVMNNHQDMERVNVGDVLVLPFADSNWTPLFPLLGGLVIESGSALSHAAILAREYGLPTVGDLHLATSAIRDGDEIVVDGDLGEVMVSSERPDSTPSPHREAEAQQSAV